MGGALWRAGYTPGPRPAPVDNVLSSPYTACPLYSKQSRLYILYSAMYLVIKPVPSQTLSLLLVHNVDFHVLALVHTHVHVHVHVKFTYSYVLSHEYELKHGHEMSINIDMDMDTDTGTDTSTGYSYFLNKNRLNYFFNGKNIKVSLQDNF